MANISDNSNTKNKADVIALGFLNNALKTPNKTALFIDNKGFTYGELLSIVKQIYLKIPKNKVYSHIGIYCNNDIFTYASILAVNLYGAAYIPLNKKFPLNRIKNQLIACDVELVLSSVSNEDVKSITESCKLVLTQEKLDGEININEITEYRKSNQPTAYIMFTSGTTGEPKGVPISHNNIQSFFSYFLKNYDFNENDRFLQTYELTFDVSVFSFFMPLMVGASCYILPDEGVKYLKIMEQINLHDITVVTMVPTVLRYAEPYLKELSFSSIRFSFFMGDALLHTLAVKWQRTLPQGQIHNFYGPTELTIVCAGYIFNETDSFIESVNNIVPLGKTFDEANTLIVDENNLPAEKGELCINGPQVVSGYLNGVSEERFFVHEGRRYYKTGDISSINENGNIVFYGRADSQVKVNGYRVELMEVESALQKVMNVDVMVVCKTTERGNIIIAYIESGIIDEQTIKQQLMQLLPEYMIPKEFVAIKRFERNINGKIDRKQFEKKIDEQRNT